MTAPREVRNIPASVRQRLRNLAHDKGDDFQGLLQWYAAERFLYRLSISAEAGRFTLKGAALFRIWMEQELRPTRDVDFLMTGSEDRNTIRTVLASTCRISCAEDGVVFDSAAVRVDNIHAGQSYGGLRARIQGRLGQARLALQIDIGFGDVITPEREQRDYPTLLDLPVPRLWVYPRETVVAEKFQAMVSRGATNSRVKDLWDIACLARRFPFHGETLRAAVAATFRRRGSSFGDKRPAALLPDYFEDTIRTSHWRVLRRQIGADIDGPVHLVDVGDELRRFLGPVCDSMIEGSPFTRTWPVGGPWQSGVPGWTEGGSGG